MELVSTDVFPLTCEGCAWGNASNAGLVGYLNLSLNLSINLKCQVRQESGSKECWPGRLGLLAAKEGIPPSVKGNRVIIIADQKDAKLLSWVISDEDTTNSSPGKKEPGKTSRKDQAPCAGNMQAVCKRLAQGDHWWWGTAVSIERSGRGSTGDACDDRQSAP